MAQQVQVQTAPNASARATRQRSRWTFPWLTWPRLILLGLLIGYWIFVSRLERVEANVVLARIFLPDLTTGQAASVTFSPWWEMVVELFHPRVLRHFIPLFVGWYLAVQATVSLMQILYDCPDRETAAAFLKRQRRDRVAYMELPFVVLPHTLESIREESILLRVGGPVQVIIPNGYAAVTERNARFLRVLPPGYHVLGRFEYLLGVIDLQPQSRSSEKVAMLTREGIPLEADVGLTFSIDPGEEPSAQRPYPFRPEAVRKAAYGGAVGGNGQVSTWDGAPLGRVIGALSGWVSTHTLDDLLVADASHDAHNLMLQAVIDKVWDKDGLLKDGIKPLRVHISRLTPPLAVSEQYTEVWLAAQEKEDLLAYATDTAQLAKDLEMLHDEGQLLIVQSIVEAIRRTQQEAGGRMSGYILAMSLVEALQKMFHLSVEEARVVGENTGRVEEKMDNVTQRLAGLEESLRLPTINFNPSKPD